MIVYKLTDLTNGKIYVGQTKLTVEERFYFHCYADTHIGHAIREHGKENFLREVLATCEARGEAYALEKRYIAQFDCIFLAQMLHSRKMVWASCSATCQTLIQ